MEHLGSIRLSDGTNNPITVSCYYIILRLPSDGNSPDYLPAIIYYPWPSLHGVSEFIDCPPLHLPGGKGGCCSRDLTGRIGSIFVRSYRNN
ncbi:hypothetical protein L873DRAFT_1802283 [Choiromyces venosus 120613-1]|uniref:Uncharacterized protein n=1 Tax=Choiromyces venosus 120613-1 TaxID=1336337 RepID=A0A3N4JVI1_9PEZI|nr:hypothetical protein L873DRAFT_1802283 [Choiromyces venosus 120613-1]